MAQSVNRSRKDDNQDAIVEALEASGCEVQSLAGIGRGCADLLVGTGDFDHPWKVLEVKDGSKPPSQRTLTDDEIKWHRRFNRVAEVWIVYDEIGALWVCGKTNEVPKLKPVRLVD